MPNDVESACEIAIEQIDPDVTVRPMISASSNASYMLRGRGRS